MPQRRTETSMPCTAQNVLDRLETLRTPHGIRMGEIFALAKACGDMQLAEIERLLERPEHEARVAAVSVMDAQARSRGTTAARRQELFDLYLRRHDRIDTWDLVDRSAIWVVGEHLVNGPRDVLHELARSADPARRRTSILATMAFIRRGQLDDTFRVAAKLVADTDETVSKAVGWMLREAGKRDQEQLIGFLDRHQPKMPRVAVRFATERLAPNVRAQYVRTTGKPTTGRGQR